jgi:predicted protein tyrosine phosphatase
MIVASIQGCRDALGPFDPDMLVSIFSPRHPVRILKSELDKHLALCCHDIEEPYPRLQMPRRGSVEYILDKVKARAPERILIHCTAGLSRSPALAVAVLASQGVEPGEACRAVHEAVPEASPNRAILALAGEIIGLDLVAPANATFAYNRGTFGAIGRRIGFREVSFPACN